MTAPERIARLRRQARHALALRRARRQVAAGLAPDGLAEAAWLFDELGVSVEQATAVERDALAACGHRERPEGSLHYLWFATLQAAGFAPTIVLELGTFRAEATEYLATLWPKSTVHTVDLPVTDPILVRFGRAYRDTERARRLQRENIVVHEANTLLLPGLDLPDPDLVWLDAGHEFPEVAWDHAHCLHHLRVGGWLFTDDVRTDENTLQRDRPAFYDVWRVVEYWNARQPDAFRLLPKRLDPVASLADPKHIGALRKTVPVVAV